MKARMLPTTPPLVACPNCLKPISLLDASPIDEVEKYSFGMPFFGEPEPLTAEEVAEKQALEAKKEKYKAVTEYLLLSARQCTEYVASTPLGNSELAQRMYAWQRVNDERIAEDYRAFTRRLGRTWRSIASRTRRWRTVASLSLPASSSRIRG
jgi:hypothetical protein